MPPAECVELGESDAPRKVEVQLAGPTPAIRLIEALKSPRRSESFGLQSARPQDDGSLSLNGSHGDRKAELKIALPQGDSHPALLQISNGALAVGKSLNFDCPKINWTEVVDPPKPADHAHLEKLSDSEILARIERLEQICAPWSDAKPNPQRTWSERSGRRIKALGDEAERRLLALKENFIEAAQNWNFESWPEKKDGWTKKLRAEKTDAERCRRLRLVYARAIARLDTLTPEHSIDGIFDIMIDKDKPLDAATRRDRERAAWELRYFFTRDKKGRIQETLKEKEIPADCHPMMAAARKRYEFIFTERRPLGIAIGMCARPMSAHYVDDDEKNPGWVQPQGWNFWESGANEATLDKVEKGSP